MALNKYADNNAIRHLINKIKELFLSRTEASEKYVKKYGQTLDEPVSLFSSAEDIGAMDNYVLITSGTSDVGGLGIEIESATSGMHAEYSSYGAIIRDSEYGSETVITHDNVTTPVLNSQSLNLEDVDTGYSATFNVSKQNIIDEETGEITDQISKVSISGGGKNVLLTGIVPPQSDDDAANKKYVDDTLDALLDNAGIPTKVSELENDAGYITDVTEDDVIEALGYMPSETDTKYEIAKTNIGSEWSTVLYLNTVNGINTYASEPEVDGSSILPSQFNYFEAGDEYYYPALAERARGIEDGYVVDIVHGGTNATTAAGALKNFGLTATAAELNYCDGVTSNIQTQINEAADKINNHTNDSDIHVTSAEKESWNHSHPYLSNATKYAASTSVGGAATYSDNVNIVRITSQLTSIASGMAIRTESIYFGGSDAVSYGCPTTYCIINIKKGDNHRTIMDCYNLSTGDHYINGNLDARNVNDWTGWRLQPNETVINNLIDRITALESALANKQDKIYTWGDLASTTSSTNTVNVSEEGA